MEKTTILVGKKSYYTALLREENVKEALEKRNVDIVRYDPDNLIIETYYTRIAFIWDITKQPLNEVEADAIFGQEPYRLQLAPYLKKRQPYDMDVDLVDYICEMETKGKLREAQEAYDKMIKDYINPSSMAPGESLHEKVYIATAQRSGKTASLMKEWERYLHSDKVVSYTKEDCDITYDLYKKCLSNDSKKLLPAIKNVIFKNPATIVFWADGTKTVVRTQDNEPYDPEKGLAMAMCKKMLGNERDYYHTFLHWIKKA